MRQKSCDGAGKAAQRHGLQHDLARTGDDGVEKPLAAEEHVLDALDALNVNAAALAHHGKVACVDDEPFAGGKLMLNGGTVDLKKSQTASGELLHDEAFAAEEAGADLFLEEDRQLHAARGGKEGGFLHDDGAVGRVLYGADRTGKAGAEGDGAAPASGGVDVLENPLPRPPALVCISMLGLIQTIEPLSVNMDSPASSSQVTMGIGSPIILYSINVSPSL